MSAGTNQADREYSVKAAFILNFLKFVEWPSDAFENGNSPIVIAIAGKDPFGPVIDQTVQGKNVDGRPIVVRRLKLDSDTRGVQLAFLGEPAKDKVVQWMSSRKTLPILSVSEYPGHAQAGVMINFFVEDGHVRFEINPEAAKRAGLTISSKLLSLAKVVSGGR